MSSQSIIEVEATYVDQLETENFKQYKRIQELTAENKELRKDLEVMSYQARLFQASAEATMQRYADVLGEEEEELQWEPDSIEREEGL